jgi:hypothetical protein
MNLKLLPDLIVVALGAISMYTPRFQLKRVDCLTG